MQIKIGGAAVEIKREEIQGHHVYNIEIEGGILFFFGSMVIAFIIGLVIGVFVGLAF